MTGTLRLRIFGTMLLPLVLGVLLACAASCAFLQSTYVALFVDRLGVIANDIGDKMEANGDVGVPLSALTSVQALLEDERARNPGITSVAVFLDDGRIRFATDRASIGEAVPGSWRRRGTGAGGVWSHVAGDQLVVGAPIGNSFGQVVGGVVLRASGGLAGFRRFEAFRTVLLVALLFLALAAGGSFALASHVAGQLRAPLALAMSELGAATAYVGGGAAAPAGEMAALADLIEPLARAERALARLEEEA